MEVDKLIQAVCRMQREGNQEFWESQRLKGKEKTEWKEKLER